MESSVDHLMLYRTSCLGRLACLCGGSIDGTNSVVAVVLEHTVSFAMSTPAILEDDAHV